MNKNNPPFPIEHSGHFAQGFAIERVPGVGVDGETKLFNLLFLLILRK